jgi:alpha-tubulin suppressor-like RCC1 family protein
MYFFGNNSEGQAGIASGEEIISRPLEIHGLDPKEIRKVSCAAKQSFVITSASVEQESNLCGGVVLSCGENDNNELGRSGKRSIFQRIDALEAFSITEFASGDGFSLCITRDGKLIGWGRNDMGQLGSGNREAKDKPKIIPFSERILQLSVGAQHVCALTTSG